MTGSGDILKAYAEEAEDIIPRFEALRAEDVLAPVAAFLPIAPARIADIGAGTGRDADWFARQGYTVCAVEPVAELADFGKRTQAAGIEWVDDRLPDLAALRGAARRFDLVFAESVWHHLDEADSAASLAALREILVPSGRLIISLKQFPADRPASRGILTEEKLVQQVAAAGFSVLHCSRANPHQDHNRTAGNMWTWLVLEQGKGAA